MGNRQQKEILERETRKGNRREEKMKNGRGRKGRRKWIEGGIIGERWKQRWETDNKQVLKREKGGRERTGKK